MDTWENTIISTDARILEVCQRPEYGAHWHFGSGKPIEVKKAYLDWQQNLLVLILIQKASPWSNLMHFSTNYFFVITRVAGRDIKLYTQKILILTSYLP